MASETSAVQSSLVFAGIAALILAFGVATDPPPTRPIDFNRDVRPILSDRCFGCHGPDAAKRKAGLRLDTPEGAFAVPDDGLPAIAPGSLWGSEAVHRIDSDDPDEVMPPPSLKRPLSESERAILRRWIEEGAEYRPHWAFVPPALAPLPEEPASNEPPANGAASWPRDPIDAFVLAGLRAAGLTPAPDADRATLLRRVTLVLTGLPPTPEEVDGFVADTAADAYERRVDALLASPRVAEHMATTWLDLARFADTYGYQSDAECFTWPWRDWLLRVLASNMPYDRFVTALVAGDLVPNATLDDRIATAFNRLHRMTEEGGSIAEEFRQEGIADRVSTFGTTFLGLTLECARCHDHKYDPIPTSEFYGLAAMFGRIDENGLKSFAHPANVPPPVVRLLTPEQDRRAEILRAAVRAARASVDEKAHAVAAAFDPRGERPLPPLPSPIARYPFETLDNGTTPNSIAGGAPASTDRQRPEQLGSIALADGHAEPDGKAIAFDGDGGLLLPGLPPFTRHDPITIGCWIRLGEANRRATLLHSSGFYTNDADASGLELLIAEGRLRWSVIQLWPGSAISLETATPLATERWHHLVVTYDGLGRGGIL